MEKVNPTKRLLAEALKDMSQTMPLKNITVQKLVTRCNLNRGTFYYHFKDVPDLINWTFHQDITIPTHDYINTSPTPQSNVSILVLGKLYENKAFYIQAFQLQGQNNFRDFMLEEVRSNWLCLYKRLLSQQKPSLRPVSPAIQEALENALTYFFYGHFFATQQWILDGMKTPPDILANMLDTAANKGLQTMLEESLL